MPATRRATGLAVAALLLNACTWGLSWWPFRRLEAAGLHALWSTALVYGLTVLVVSLLQPRAWNQLRREPMLWAIALATGASNLGFNWAVTLGEVARVVLLFYLTPLWTVGLARWLLGEHADAGVWLRIVLALGGAFLVLGSGPSTSGREPVPLADALALMAGFFFALNSVLLRRGAALPESGKVLAMFLGGALVAGAVAWLGAAGLLPVAVPWPPQPAPGWLLLAGALALVFLLSNLGLQYGAARLPANVTSVVMPFEIVVAAVSAALWAGEVISPPLLGGGALILGAALLAAWRGR